MNQPSILIVDDEPNNFDVIEAFLPDQKYDLHYAASGQEALDSLVEFSPDLILLDVMMPEMDGIEVCQQIKSTPQWQSIPIIMVTALTSKEDLAECLKKGADDFISKPVNSFELRARVQSMLRIKQQYDDLQASLKLREEMVNMVVHDLRTPLTTILFGVDVLERSNNLGGNELKKITQIKLSGQKLRELIDDLLLMAKIEAGKITLNRSQIDPFHLIKSVVSDFEEIAAQKDVKLISLLPEKGSTINVDATMLYRVLDNLVSNAIKFSSSQSSVMICGEILDSGGIRIEIADFGQGVPEDLRQSIFEKYEIGIVMQGVSQVGLGLAFCKMIINAHDGEISLESNHPQGVIFKIILPS